MLLKSYLSLKLAIIFLVLSISCVLAYNASGSFIASNGVFHEQFGFIPLGWLFFFLSVGCTVFYFMKLVFTRQ